MIKSIFHLSILKKQSYLKANNIEFVIQDELILIPIKIDILQSLLSTNDVIASSPLEFVNEQVSGFHFHLDL